MLNRKKITLFLLFTHSLFGASLNDYITLKGFGTIGASTVFDKNVEFVAYVPEKSGVKKGEINLFNNSNLGLQSTITPNESLSMTMQIIAINENKHKFKTKLDWAYLSYDTGYDLTLRGGHFRLPLFNSSELSYLGYARTWIRPALVFYGITTYEYIDGFDILYNSYYKNLDLSFQLAYGRQKDNSPINLNKPVFYLKSNDMKIFKVNSSYENFTGSLTLYHANNDYEINVPRNPKNDFGKTKTKMVTFECSYIYNNFTIEGGYGISKTDKKIPSEEMAYLGLSYQIDNIRPYILYSMKKNKPKSLIPNDKPPIGIPQKSYSLGIRYDIATNMDLKAQFDFFKDSELIRNDRGLTDGKGLTFALEFLF